MATWATGLVAYETPLMPLCHCMGQPLLTCQLGLLLLLELLVELAALLVLLVELGHDGMGDGWLGAGTVWNVITTGCTGQT
jgi:hypothetical protein